MLTLSTARLPPKRTLTSSISSHGVPSGDGRCARSHRPAPPWRWRARSTPARPLRRSTAQREHGVAERVHDLHQPAREVHEQDEQADAAREETAPAAVAEQHGSPRTQSAPRIGPATEPRPPMIAVATRRIDSSGLNASSGCTWRLQGDEQAARERRHAPRPARTRRASCARATRSTPRPSPRCRARRSSSDRCRCAAAAAMAMAITSKARSTR